MPLVVLFSGGNMHDSIPLTALLEVVLSYKVLVVAFGTAQTNCTLYKAYDYERCREACVVRGIRPR